MIRSRADGFFGNWAKHSMRQKMTEEELRKYREEIEWPMENLAIALEEMGFGSNRLEDHELIEVVTRKLKMLHSIAATVMNEELLKAVMKE